MTDRELLELAAKAAGITVVRSRLHDRLQGDLLVEASPEGGQSHIGWNPLTDDGDAFRLAVQLSLFDGIDRQASAIAAEVNFDMDPCEATRRAIVRAAAATAMQRPSGLGTFKCTL